MAITIQEAINNIIVAVNEQPFKDTVDVVKIGDPTQPLTGIITTFLANVDVIEQAAALNANLIITHEPIFYNHLDQVDWLETNAAYQAKRRLIEERNVVIWRFHDYMHSIRPDPVMVGMARELGWESSFNIETLVAQIQPMKLGELVAYVKAKLRIQTLRMIGDLDMSCRNVGLMPGFPPPQFQIGLFNQQPVDVFICGEIHEWEMSEYIRDTNSFQQHKALIVTGHAASEEPGMRYIIPWLQERVPGVPIQFVPNKPVFQYV